MKDCAWRCIRCGKPGKGDDGMIADCGCRVFAYRRSAPNDMRDWRRPGPKAVLQ